MNQFWTSNDIFLNNQKYFLDHRTPSNFWALHHSCSVCVLGEVLRAWWSWTCVATVVAFLFAVLVPYELHSYRVDVEMCIIKIDWKSESDFDEIR